MGEERLGLGHWHQSHLGGSVVFVADRQRCTFKKSGWVVLMSPAGAAQAGSRAPIPQASQLRHSREMLASQHPDCHFLFYDLKEITSPGCLGAHKENAAPAQLLKKCALVNK